MASDAKRGRKAEAVREYYRKTKNKKATEKEIKEWIEKNVGSGCVPSNSIITVVKQDLGFTTPHPPTMNGAVRRAASKPLSRQSEKERATALALPLLRRVAKMRVPKDAVKGVLGKLKNKDLPAKLKKQAESKFDTLYDHVIDEYGEHVVNLSYYEDRHNRVLSDCIKRFLRHLEREHHIKHGGRIVLGREGARGAASEVGLFELTSGDLDELGLTKAQIRELARRPKKREGRKSTARNVPFEEATTEQLGEVLTHLMQEDEDLYRRAEALYKERRRQTQHHDVVKKCETMRDRPWKSMAEEEPE